MCVYWYFQGHFSELSYGFLSKSKGRVLDELRVPFKVGLSPSKKIASHESFLKMMKNVFYFILKASFVLKIFKFLP